ncbi:hypothetical protein BASA50_006215 [Batrachochytrium salamandrivorans]|uniref:Uncharacterized protein n=1 Tax=Batrachochytrium salamandrivorans TaxID=1357716 RepID=A0ABQ8FAM6_9FUNG|nr:hypothetical protein BASA60_009827 [Batrachochytrium salamandrivorans]KAH6575672.1 hypothetical protein BASA62_001822 [Batrachochytrium salamandrivorans]KAH6594953.1 hypothetical protein BASA50_006215 [Batrachochytrium salamandrivorans]KAH6595780.1 hypothetical protein BASA61_003698 [Batrachochytrium salamandrivorans]KAH9249189.1 hypothetical protein BASA81_013088 [Batrachochytrium salamandrivorans]
MSKILRNIFKTGESAIRTKEYQNRLFWQKDSHIPTHGRKRGDAFSFALGLGATLACCGISVNCIVDALNSQ